MLYLGLIMIGMALGTGEFFYVVIAMICFLLELVF